DWHSVLYSWAITDWIRLTTARPGGYGGNQPVGPVLAISLVERAGPVDTRATLNRLVLLARNRRRAWVCGAAVNCRAMMVRARPPAGRSGRMSVDANLPADTQEFRELISAVLRCDPVATETFCREYQAHIIRIVRRRLMRRLRSKYDSIDIAQDVWKS